MTEEMVATDTTSKFCSRVNSRSFTWASRGPWPDWNGPLKSWNKPLGLKDYILKFSFNDKIHDIWLWCNMHALLIENTFPDIPLSRQNVHEFEQKLAEHLRTVGWKVDLQATQKLMHCLGGSGSHLRAVLACCIGAGARQEAHQNMNQGRISYHLLCCAFLRADSIAGGWKFKDRFYINHWTPGNW